MQMLWGRNIELEELQDWLAERLSAANAERLRVVTGANGMGKTALINELQDFLKDLDAPIIVISPQGLQKTSFNTGAQSNISEDELQRVFLRSFSFHGFSSQESMEPMDEEGLRPYLQRVLIKTVAEIPMVVVFLDDYDQLSQAKKIFIKENIFDQLLQFSLSHDVRFVISSQLFSDLSSNNIESFWPSVKSREVALKALSPEDLRKWIVAQKEPESILDDLVARTSGVPARIKEYFAARTQQRAVSLATSFAGDSGKKVFAQLSLLNCFDEILIKKTYPPVICDSIFNYLREHPEVFPRREDGLYALSADYRQVAQSIAESLNNGAKEDFLERVGNAWESRKAELAKEIEALQRSIAEDETLAKKTAQELQEISPKLLAIQKKYAAMQKKWRLFKPDRKNENLFSFSKNIQQIIAVLLILLGVVWIYICLLSFGLMKWEYCIVGILLVFAGLTFPQVYSRFYPQKTLVTPKSSKLEIPPILLQFEKNLQFLKMHETALEHRQKLLYKRVPATRQKISELEIRLRQPYI